jgi:abortive infection bacteriophage resistance protein
LTFEQQLDLLKGRGLEVTDDLRALDCLRRIGYYRLSAYWYPLRALTVLQDPETGALSHRREDEFVEGARFQDVVGLYVFDKHLRLLLADALERIEVAVRVSIAYLLGSRSRI